MRVQFEQDSSPEVAAFSAFLQQRQSDNDQEGDSNIRNAKLVKKFSKFLEMQKHGEMKCGKPKFGHWDKHGPWGKGIGRGHHHGKNGSGRHCQGFGRPGHSAGGFIRHCHGFGRHGKHGHRGHSHHGRHGSDDDQPGHHGHGQFGRRFLLWAMAHNKICPMRANDTTQELIADGWNPSPSPAAVPGAEQNVYVSPRGGCKHGTHRLFGGEEEKIDAGPSSSSTATSEAAGNNPPQSLTPLVQKITIDATEG